MKRVWRTLVIGTVLFLMLSGMVSSTAPYMVWQASPDLMPIVIPRVNYPETHPIEPGEFDAQHYPTYDEVVSLMKKWARDYPDLVDLYVNGVSYEGRDIWQMTISNKKTGNPDWKPAMWVGGNRHSGEVTARVAALDFANRLLTGYGVDSEITHLVDTCTFYVRPMENPDGAELYLCTAQTNRSTNRPMDNDGDGLLDEDPGDDLDGDGFLRQMRQYVGPGNGNYVVDPADPSGRLMRSVGSGYGDYRVYSEGLDNDEDGRFNEDGIGGLDLHRNYPENWRPMTEATGMGWTQSGAGEYPLSEPEIRSIVLFLLSHPNISICQTMDTAVPMHLRPPSTSKSEESMFPSDLRYYVYFDDEGRKLSGYARAGDVYQDYGRGNPLFGHSPDFGYFQFGAIWYGDELWGNQDYVEDFNGDLVIDMLDRLWMNDNVEEIRGMLFKDWTPYEHPQLGLVEIGGWNPKFWTQNAPAGSYLQTAVEKETRFNMLLAKSLPLLAITDMNMVYNDDGTTTIAITISNKGFLPDALEQAWLVKIVKEGYAELRLGEGLSRASGSPSLRQNIGFFAGALQADGHTKTVTWTVSGKGTASIVVRSTRGGTVTKTLHID